MQIQHRAGGKANYQMTLPTSPLKIFKTEKGNHTEMHMTTMHPRNFCVIGWKTLETTLTSSLAWKPPSQDASWGGNHHETVHW